MRMSGFCRCAARRAVGKRSQPAGCAMAISLVSPGCNVNPFACLLLFIVVGLFGYNAVYNGSKRSLHLRPSISTAHLRCISTSGNGVSRHPLSIQRTISACKSDSVLNAGDDQKASVGFFTRPQTTRNPKAKPAERIPESSRIDQLAILSVKSDQELPQEAVSQVKTLLLFVGYPRSCHSLVGSLLDAHPNIVVAHEYNLLERWMSLPKGRKTNRSYVLNELYQKSVKDARVGIRSRVPGSREALNEPNKYFYGVANQWQGTYDNDLLVIGDKRGALTSLFVARSKSRGLDVIQKLADGLRLQVRFIHVVRNPYDNISTMLLRELNKRRPSQQHSIGTVTVNWRHQSSKAKRFFHRLVNTVENVRSRFPLLDVHCERLIENPKAVLQEMCKYLNVTCSGAYLDDCSQIVNKAPSRTRDFINWPADVRQNVETEMRRYPFLRNYTFDN